MQFVNNIKDKRSCVFNKKITHIIYNKILYITYNFLHLKQQQTNWKKNSKNIQKTKVKKYNKKKKQNKLKQKNETLITDL